MTLRPVVSFCRIQQQLILIASSLPLFPCSFTLNSGNQALSPTLTAALMVSKGELPS